MLNILESTAAMPHLHGIASAGAKRLFRASALGALEPAAVGEFGALGRGTAAELNDPCESAERPDCLPGATPSEQVNCGLLATRGTEIAKAFGAMAGALQAGVSLHCAAGNDRTGLLAALVLEVAGVPRHLILEDCARSSREHLNQTLPCALGEGTELQAALQRHVARKASALGQVLETLEDRFGSAACYLLAQGAAPGELTMVRQSLARPEAAA